MIPHLPSPRKILNFKVRNLMIVNDNLSKRLPKEIEQMQLTHKRILMAQILELTGELKCN